MNHSESMPVTATRSSGDDDPMINEFTFVETIQNPIPSSIRGWLYVCAVAVGVVIGPVTTVLTELGVRQAVTNAVSAGLGGFVAVVAAIARQALTIEE